MCYWEQTKIILHLRDKSTGLWELYLIFGGVSLQRKWIVLGQNHQANFSHAIVSFPSVPAPLGNICWVPSEPGQILNQAKNIFPGSHFSPAF